MMKTASVIGLLLLAIPAQGKELAGVTLLDAIEVDGKILKLNGIGLRKKAIFKVYLAGLYLEETGSDPVVILGKDQVRQVQIVLLRDLEKSKVIEAIYSGFEKNYREKMPSFKERLAKFTAVIPDLKEGQTLKLTYLPGKGSTVKASGGAEATSEGKDFADALFSVWIGQTPVDDDLKQGMLGK